MRELLTNVRIKALHAALEKRARSIREELKRMPANAKNTGIMTSATNPSILSCRSVFNPGGSRRTKAAINAPKCTMDPIRAVIQDEADT